MWDPSFESETTAGHLELVVPKNYPEVKRNLQCLGLFAWFFFKLLIFLWFLKKIILTVLGKKITQTEHIFIRKYNAQKKGDCCKSKIEESETHPFENALICLFFSFLKLGICHTSVLCSVSSEKVCICCSSEWSRVLILKTSWRRRCCYSFSLEGKLRFKKINEAESLKGREREAEVKHTSV